MSDTTILQPQHRAEMAYTAAHRIASCNGHTTKPARSCVALAGSGGVGLGAITRLLNPRPFRCGAWAAGAPQSEHYGAGTAPAPSRLHRPALVGVRPPVVLDAALQFCWCHGGADSCHLKPVRGGCPWFAPRGQLSREAEKAETGELAPTSAFPTKTLCGCAFRMVSRLPPVRRGCQGLFSGG